MSFQVECLECVTKLHDSLPFSLPMMQVVLARINYGHNFFKFEGSRPIAYLISVWNISSNLDDKITIIDYPRPTVFNRLDYY